MAQLAHDAGVGPTLDAVAVVDASHGFRDESNQTGRKVKNGGIGPPPPLRGLGFPLFLVLPSGTT